ncbi:MAG: hypothetical protein V4692_16535 [Bdellovibrionota bacterium]
MVIFYAVYALRFGEWITPNSAFMMALLAFWAANFFWLYLLNLYHLEAQIPFWLKPLQTLIASFLAGSFIILLFYIIGAVEFSGLIGRGVLITSQIVFAIWAATHRFLISKWLRKVSARARWIALGSSEIISTFFDDISKSGVPGVSGATPPTAARASPCTMSTLPALTSA